MIVDVDAYVNKGRHGEQARKECAKRFFEAMKSVGFVTIVNHGVDEALVARLMAKGKAFFRLPTEDKLRFNFGATYGSSFGGYTPPQVEAVGKTKDFANPDIKAGTRPSAAGDVTRDDEQADSVESYVVFDPSKYHGKDAAPWPHELFRQDAFAYFQQLKKLTKLLNEIAADALQLKDRDFFHKLYTEEHDNFLRLSNYVLTDKNDKQQKVLYAPHVDYIGWTILRQDYAFDSLYENSGLEVFDGEKWEKVNPVRNSFIVNCGELLSLATNSQLKAAIHQVVFRDALRPNDVNERFTIPYFTGPHPSQVVHLPTGETVKVQDFLHAKLNKSNL